MTLFDLVIIVLAIGGGAVGWRKGLTGQIGSLGGILLAVILCRWFGSDLAESFTSPTDTAETKMLHSVLSYLLISVVAYSGVRIAAGFARDMFRTLHMTDLNRAGGALFGVFEWLLGLSLLINLWVAVFPNTELRTKHSVITATVMDLGPVVLGSETVSDLMKFAETQRPESLNTKAQNDSIQQNDAPATQNKP